MDKGYLECIWEGHVRAACIIFGPCADQRSRQPESLQSREEEDEAIQAEAQRLEFLHRYDRARDGESETPNFYRILEFGHCETRPKTWPDSKPAYDGGLDRVKKTVDFCGKTMQVIVKLSNIVLTPEKPEYRGGAWRFEGRSDVTQRTYCKFTAHIQA